MPNMIGTGLATAKTRNNAGTYKLVDEPLHIRQTNETFRAVLGHTGDLLILAVTIESTAALPVSVESSVDGVTGLPNAYWQPITVAVSDATMVKSMRLFAGVVNDAGKDLITCTFTATPTNALITYDLWEFTCNYGPDTTWIVDQVASQDVTTPTTTLTFTGLSINYDTKEIFFGFIVPGGTGTVGATSGFTYDDDNKQGYITCYKLNYTSGSPTATQSPASNYLRQSVTIAAEDSVGANDSDCDISFTANIPTGTMWVIYKISFELQTSTGVKNDIFATVYMNGRVIDRGLVPGAIAGPPFYTYRPGDDLVVSVTNAPIGSEIVVDVLYQEYPNGAPLNIAGVV